MPSNNDKLGATEISRGATALSEIVIYQHTRWNEGQYGWELRTNLTWFYIGDDKNDQASSCVVVSGTWRLYTETGCDENQGTYKDFGPGSYERLEDYGIPNDSLSSFKPLP